MVGRVIRILQSPGGFGIIYHIKESMGGRYDF